MMNKKKTSVIISFKYFLMIPLATGLLLTNCSTNTNDRSNIEEDPTTTRQDKVQHVEQIEEQVDLTDVTDTKENTLDRADNIPSFIGGEQAMTEFIQTNLKYPEEAQKNGIEGRVIVSFIVTKSGNIEEAVVKKGIDPACDAEALRVIKMMPRWNPGIQDGKYVDVNYTLPIVFKLVK